MCSSCRNALESGNICLDPYLPVDHPLDVQLLLEPLDFLGHERVIKNYTFTFEVGLHVHWACSPVYSTFFAFTKSVKSTVIFPPLAESLCVFSTCKGVNPHCSISSSPCCTFPCQRTNACGSLQPPPPSGRYSSSCISKNTK